MGRALVQDSKCLDTRGVAHFGMYVRRHTLCCALTSHVEKLPQSFHFIYVSIVALHSLHVQYCKYYLPSASKCTEPANEGMLLLFFDHHSVRNDMQEQVDISCDDYNAASIRQKNSQYSSGLVVPACFCKLLQKCFRSCFICKMTESNSLPRY